VLDVVLTIVPCVFISFRRLIAHTLQAASRQSTALFGEYKFKLPS
jgi:hypothetical protein